MKNGIILSPEIKEEINNLQKKESLRWIFACIINWLIIFSTFYAAYYFQSLLVDAFAILVIGNRQHTIALLGHEGSHYMLSSNRKWNDFLTGVFCYWPLGVSLAGFREFHFTHHNSLASSNDPELKFEKNFAPRYELPITRKNMLLNFTKDILGLSIQEVFLVKQFFTAKKRIHALIPTLFLVLIAIALLYFGFIWIFFYWLLALYTSFWAFFRIRVYIEHIGTKDTHRIKSNPILNFIFFPIGADTHWEHHQWPAMLWYQRSKARLLVAEPNLIKIQDLFLTFENEKKTILHREDSKNISDGDLIRF